MFRALIVLLGLAGAALAGAAPAPAVPGPLVAEVAGVPVPDPYRALEEVDAPATREWMQAHAGWAREQLDRLPGLRALRERVDALDAGRADLLVAVRVASDGRLFYVKRVAGASAAQMFVHERGRERLLLDPVAWRRRDGVPQAINGYSVSPGGRHVAVVVSRNDNELGELQVFDTRSGAPVGKPVPAIWGELSAAWSPDGRRFVVAQGAEAARPGGAPYGRFRLLERTVSTGAERVVGGWQAGFGPEMREKDWPGLELRAAGPYAVATHYEGISATARVWFTRTDRWLAAPARARWTPLLGVDAQVQGSAAAGRWFYGRSFDAAPRYRLLRWDLQHPDRPPVDALPASDAVLDDFAAAADGVYAVLRQGSRVQLVFLPHGAAAGAARPVALPFEGAVTLFGADAAQPGVVFTLEGWTRELQALQARGTRTTALPLLAPPRNTVGRDWMAEDASCRSHDGTQVPMTLVHKRGLARDGARPTLMDGYGGYGFAELPYFSPRLEALLERGGVFVDVKPRGGGAYGREWYQAGVGPRKANTWKDMIACAEALVAMGVTRPDRLVIQGTSMGGVAVGRAITERPELFAGALVRVGITDALRFIEATPNGPNHEEEMGSVKTEAGVRQLLAMSTYHQVKEGTRYPAVLFTAGLHDGRVPAWQAFKTYARLAAASTSGQPVLLRVEDAGGHGVGTTAEQRNAEFTDRLGFMLWVTGDLDFKPPTPP